MTMPGDWDQWHASVRAAFLPMDHLCLDAARWHPLPISAVEAQHQYLQARARNACWDDDPGMAAQNGARAGFARLIGASPSSVALVPSTGWAEQMVVRSLGLPQAGAILTDLGHFDASVLHYDMLARAGGNILCLPRGAEGLDLDMVAQALAGNRVSLVATSIVSNTTGIDVDLAALVALAHGHGALVFVDIIQAVGAVPFDVVATDVDFCAASAYKWMMGDMGMGFLYVSPSVLPRLQRPVYGFRQMQTFIEPWPPREDRDWVLRTDAEGYFGVNARAAGAAASISASLGLVEKLGVYRIQAYRAALLLRARAGLEQLGYIAITPASSIAPFVVFDTTSHPDTADQLRAANINAGVSPNRLRVAPALQVMPDDIDRLIDVLAGTR